MADFEDLRIQCMLEPGPGVQWLTQIRRVLYPNHGTAHISVVPHFTIHEDHYQDLLENLADVAAKWESFEFEADGVCGAKPHGCVAIRVRDNEGILQEIMDEVPPLVRQTHNRFPPHVTIYKGSPKLTWFPYFREFLGFKSLRSRVEAKLNHYRNLRGWSVSGKVIGLQLLQGNGILESYLFGS
ncbi:hypothetical protein B0H17DRAFT_1191624 [Mycena rosella]|uniref:2'-5' RNA ligase family protein n=1 Tax=Mycena rosella TaxID=1033263 RepID=A0AAD7MAE0_MYCRO|nr:hypothetical protein B0H17DRAFT_1191624 [Mycena rosella]